jgi:hypothetical protein
MWYPYEEGEGERRRGDAHEIANHSFRRLPAFHEIATIPDAEIESPSGKTRTSSCPWLELA